MNNGSKLVSDLKSALPKDITNFINFYADNNQQYSDDKLVRSIVQHIENDDMSTNVRQTINENPSILNDDRIQNALNDPANEHSVTLRQLKRQYDQWAALPENKKKYDL